MTDSKWKWILVNSELIKNDVMYKINTKVLTSSFPVYKMWYSRHFLRPFKICNFLECTLRKDRHATCKHFPALWNLKPSALCSWPLIWWVTHSRERLEPHLIFKFLVNSSMLILSMRMKSPRPTSVWSAMLLAWVTNVTSVLSGDLTPHTGCSVCEWLPGTEAVVV